MLNQQRTDGDHADLHELLRQTRHIGSDLRQHARLQPDMRLVRDRFLPAATHLRTGTQRFDRFQAAERFDQDCLLVVAVFL